MVLRESLLEAGCQVTAYDRVAMDGWRRRIGDRISYASNLYDTVIDADAIFHVTEWKEFRMPSWEVIRRAMKSNPVLIDGRNVYSAEELGDIAYLKIG